MQERWNSIANALELRLSCTNPSISSMQSCGWNKLQISHLGLLRINTILAFLLIKEVGFFMDVRASAATVMTKFGFGMHRGPASTCWVNSSPRGQNGRHYADDIFKCIFMNEKFCISIWISLKSVPNGLIDKKSALVQVMTWRWAGNSPLTEAMLTKILYTIWRHLATMS